MTNNGVSRTAHTRRIPTILTTLTLISGLCGLYPGCDDNTSDTTGDTAATIDTTSFDITDTDTTQLDTQTPSDTQEMLPLKGSVAVGEYDQPGLSGVTLYGVFAQTDDLEAPFDETLGSCRLRYIAADEKIPEPLGLEVGEVSISGDGAQQAVSLDSFDLGDQQGGIAYTLVPDDLPKTIFNNTGNVQITVSGHSPYPALSVSVPVPQTWVDLIPALDDLPADLTQGVSFTWTPTGADAVLIELDAKAADRSATQLRCRFEDTGSAVIDGAALGHFQGVSYFGSAVRQNEGTAESGTTSLTGVLSRRQVVFVF